MSNPVCQARPDVSKEKLSVIQERANQQFTEAKPVLDDQLLTAEERKDREIAICHSTYSCGRGLEDYAKSVTGRINPLGELWVRTQTNITRLFESNRVTTEQISDLIKIMLDGNRVTDFRNAARELFLGNGLFYYEHVPYASAVMCYMPKE